MFRFLNTLFILLTLIESKNQNEINLINYIGLYTVGIEYGSNIAQNPHPSIHTPLSPLVRGEILSYLFLYYT